MVCVCEWVWLCLNSARTQHKLQGGTGDEGEWGQSLVWIMYLRNVAVSLTFFWRTKWDQNHPLSLVNIKTRDHICTTLFSIWQNSQFLRDKHQSSFVYPHLISLCRESKHYYCCREKWRGTRNSIHVLPAAWHYCTPDADWQPWPWSWSCKVQTLVTFLIFVFEFTAMFVYCGKVCKFICSCFFAIFAIYLGITRLP